MAYTPQTATNSNGDFSGSIVYSSVRPKDPSQAVATVYSNDIRGTVHHYATLAERNAIIEQRREWGMLCTVYNDGTPSNNGTYILNYGGSSASITDNIYWGIYSPGSQVVLGPNSGLTYSGGSYSTTDSSLAGVGLTKSGITFSVLLDGATPGLTVSSSGLKVLDLIMTTSSVTLDANILGKYTTDPTTLSGWDYLSIPTKSYVDAIASGLTLKQAVRVAATGSVSILSAPSQIDGVTMSIGDRVLLWKQDDTVNGTSSNGVYIYNGVGSSMSRSTDMDGNPASEVTTGVYTFVTEGTTYQGSGFVIVAAGAVSGQIQVGTQSIKWTQFSSAGNYIWNNGLVGVGNLVDIDLYGNGGLTFSSGQLKVDLATSSGLSINNGLFINTALAGTGLTMSNGVVSVNNPIWASNGLTNSGLTFSVNLKSGGLTFSNGLLDVSVGTGLTVSSGSIALSLSPLLNKGLTFSGGSYSVSIAATSGLLFDAYNSLSIDTSFFGNGLTVNNQKLVVSAGSGLTFSATSSLVPGQLLLDISDNGLTFSATSSSSPGKLSLNIGNGLTFSNSALRSSIGTGLTFNNGNIYLDGVSIAGSGLTWSNNQISFSLTGSQNRLAFWGTTSSLSSTSNLTWNSTNNVLNYSTGSASSIYPLVLENTTTGGGVSNGSVGFRLLSGSGTASFYYAKSSGGSKNDNALNISLPNSGMTINANGQNGDGHNFEVYSSGYGGGNGNLYYIVNQNVGNPKGQFVLADSNVGSGQSEFVISQLGLLTKLKGYTTGGALSYGTASQTNNIITFTNQNIYLGSYSSAPTSSVIVEIAPGSSNLIPLKLNSGTLASTTQNGGIEFDGTHSYITIGGTRFQMDNYLIGTGLTVNGLTLSTSLSSGDGLTANGNTFSVNINTNGLTFSGNQLGLNIGSGLTFSNGQLNSSVNVSGTTNTIPVFNSGGFTNSMSYQINANFGNTASNGNSFPIPGAIVVGGKYFGITSSDILQSVAVRDNSLTANGTSVYPQLGVSVGLTYSGSTGTSSAGVAAISTQVIDGVDNRRSALFTNYTDSLWGISNTGGSGGMSFGIWQSTNRVMTIGSNLNVNFQPGSTHSDSGYFFTVGGSSYFKGKITTTFSGSGLQFLGLTSGSNTSTGQYIGVDSVGNVINLTGPISGNGLTNSGSTFSVNINTNGLTFSSNQLGLNIGNGLTFSSSRLNVLIDSIPSGLTLSSTGIKVRYNQTSGLDIYSATGSTENQLYINWNNIIGNGLTWSGSQLNTSSAVLKKYATGPLSFTASETKTITHNIGNTEYIIQMYANSTGDEILSQYSGRTTNTIDITVFEDTSDAKIVIIG